MKKKGSTMVRKQLLLPSWIGRSLQGITHWIGHRRCLYRSYPLSEGALVAEVCNLIHANLPDRLFLRCEVQYSTLIGRNEIPTELTERARVDLVVSEKMEDTEHMLTRHIMEVKRGSASKRQIDSDLRRLAAVKRMHPNIRAFLILISEAKRHNRFVSEEGKYRKGKNRINKSAHSRVRGVWKAAHSFERKERAHYACIIEVYNNA